MIKKTDLQINIAFMLAVLIVELLFIAKLIE